MIAGVLLLLVFIGPDRTLQTMTQVMPSMEACEAAEKAWLAGPPDAHAIKGSEALQYRSALCVTVPMPGRDA